MAGRDIIMVRQRDLKRLHIIYKKTPGDLGFPGRVRIDVLNSYGTCRNQMQVKQHFRYGRPRSTYRC